MNGQKRSAKRNQGKVRCICYPSLLMLMLARELAISLTFLSPSRKLHLPKIAFIINHYSSISRGIRKWILHFELFWEAISRNSLTPSLHNNININSHSSKSLNKITHEHSCWVDKGLVLNREQVVKCYPCGTFFDNCA